MITNKTISKKSGKSYKTFFIENIVFKKNNLYSLLNIIARAILFLLNNYYLLFSKISILFGSFYTKIWPFLGISWYDHRFDYLRGIENYYWYERAIFTKQRIKSHGKVLDIGCGDGIFSGLFYSMKAKRIDAIDIDKTAIKHARKYYSRNNVNFINMSIEDWFKLRNKYDTILMFAVIEHFNAQEGVEILKKVGKSLTKEGLFFGSTPILKNKGCSNFEHKNEFSSQNELAKFLRKAFRNVNLYISEWPNDRNECYFECSLPT